MRRSNRNFNMPPPPGANFEHWNPFCAFCARGLGNLTFVFAGWGKLNRKCKFSNDCFCFGTEVANSYKHLFKFKVRYQPGPNNIPDSLSKLATSEDSRSKHSSEAEEYVRCVAVSATPTAMTTREVGEASAENGEPSAIRKCIDGESWDQLVYKQDIPCSGELCTIG